MRHTRLLIPALVVLASLTPVKSRAQAPPPKGWVGLVITTGIGQSNAQGAMVFNDYPVIESIDPASPAERAGLQAGDIIISINSQDLRRNPIPMASLLVPGKKIAIRYRRHDVLKTSRITVAERPVGTAGHTVISFIGPAPDRQNAAAREAREVGLQRARVTATAERVSLAPMPSVTVPMIFGPGSPSIGVAGAELTQLNDGLRELLNMKGNGVFVINVAIGTPAGESGLKSGDVILRAGSESVQHPGELIRVMRAAREQAVLLHILRKQKEHSLTLRW